MGLLGISAKSNLGETRFDAALLCLLFISIHQAYSMVDQGFFWLGALFLLSGGCQLYILLNSKQQTKQQKYRQHAALLCLLLSWLAVLSSNYDKHLVALDWVVILIIAGYLLLTTKLANIINGIGLIVLLCLLVIEKSRFTGAIELLPFIVLVIIANLLSSQNAYLISALKRSQVCDTLTGCSNREYFLQEVIKSSDIYGRYKISMSLIALKMNITTEEVGVIGRGKFDQYQLSLSQIWTSRLRNTDVLCRYHDGLFIALLPSTSLENALSLANDLTKASVDYEFDNDQNIKVHTRTVAHDELESWENWLNRVML
jgi:diguanylate cyclase (GGDEF)-like protein